MGHLELAHDYAYEAALIDLRDLHHNTRDGLHMASLAGAWIALVAGFGGLRDDEGVLTLDPHLPDGIDRLRFRLRWSEFRLTVDATHAEVIYSLRDGPHSHLTIRHAGAELTVSTQEPTTVACTCANPAARAVAAARQGTDPAPARFGRHILIAGISRVMFHIRLRRADSEEITNAPPAQMISSAITACHNR